MSELSEAALISRSQNNSVCDGDPDIAYDMGMLVFEYLYLNYSFAQVHVLMVVSREESRLEAAKEVLDMESNDLDAEIARYVYAALN